MITIASVSSVMIRSNSEIKTCISYSIRHGQVASGDEVVADACDLTDPKLTRRIKKGKRHFNFVSMVKIFALDQKKLIRVMT